MIFNYLNRVGSRTERPDRINCEIGSSDCTPLCTLFKAVSVFDIVRVDCFCTLVLGTVLEVRELTVVCVREAVIRTLF
jgi:hypothetical protein